MFWSCYLYNVWNARWADLDTSDDLSMIIFYIQVSVFGGDSFKDHQMQDQKWERESVFGPLKIHELEYLKKTVSHSVTCQLGISKSLKI